MREESLTPASIALYALLHDVGKPVIRLALRYAEGIERKDKEILTLLRLACGERECGQAEEDLLRTVISMGHEKVSTSIIRRLTGLEPSPMARETIRKITMSADIASATERGYEEAYERVRESLSEIEEEVNKKLSLSGPLSLKYTHYTAPLLSPFWVIDRAGYLNGVGEAALCGQRWNPGHGLATIRGVFTEVIDAAKRGLIGNIGKKIGDLIKELSEKKLWLPVNAVTPAHLISKDFQAMTLDEAMKRSNYSVPVGIMLKLLARLRGWYSVTTTKHIPRGLTDTVHQILKATALLIPSAVYGAIVPDISLYSHSKVTAALAAAISAGNSGVAILGLDANNIQGFIYSSTQAAAASRLMRGRSFLVEIALESLAKYAQEVLGKLPESNVVVSEGGLLTLVVPCRRNNTGVKAVEEVAEGLADELGGGIGFTVGVSECFSPHSISFFGAHGSGKTNYADIMRDLMIDITRRKLQKVPERRCIDSRPDTKIPLGYDSLTKEPVLSHEDLIPVTEDLIDYFQEIAGGKLEVGDTISRATHLSLVAGTSLRNAVAIISIYLYKYPDSSGEQPPEPSPEAVEAVVTGIRRSISKKYSASSPDRVRLHYVISAGAVRHGVGIIPFFSVGAVHVIISRNVEKPVNTLSGSAGNDPALWDIVGTVASAVVNTIKEVVGCEGLDALMRIGLINNSTDFVPDPSSRAVKRILDAVRAGCVDIGFGYRWLNTYHPIEVRAHDGVERLSLLSLDRYGVVALAKLDLDMFGDVMTVISSLSPSRSSTASDITSTVTAGAAYAITIDEAIKQSINGRNFDAIPLYGGGDDVTIYGSVGATLYLLLRIAEKVGKVLRPITGTAGLVIDDSHAPIMSIYSATVERLERGKDVKSVTALSADEPRKVSIYCGRAKVLPFVPLATFGSWRVPSVEWPLDTLLNAFSPAKVEEVVEKLGEHLSLLQKLSYLGYLAQKYLEKGSQEDKARIAIAYAYLWARNTESMSKLRKRLSDIDERMIIADPKNVDTSINTLASSKPIIDLLILAIRRKETALPSLHRLTEIQP